MEGTNPSGNAVGRTIRRRGTSIRRGAPWKVAAASILANCPHFAQTQVVASVLQSVAAQFESAHSNAAASGLQSTADNGVAKKAPAAKAISTVSRQITINP